MTTERQKASNVFTCTSLDFSSIPGTDLRRALMRCSISEAAFLVKVIIRMFPGLTSSFPRSFTYLSTIVCVFPVPGPASTTTIPSRVSIILC